MTNVSIGERRFNTLNNITLIYHRLFDKLHLVLFSVLSLKAHIGGSSFGRSTIYNFIKNEKKKIVKSEMKSELKFQTLKNSVVC